jgi:hypothetical protein
VRVRAISGIIWQMTGHNHYADCPCGWCVNYGRTRLDRRDVGNQLRLRDAAVFLKRNSANSISGCFINPNARCPVCSAPVFYYENNRGSRVFFDDLGPPWPKHPCTDHSSRRVLPYSRVTTAPTRRLLGLTQELITNANIVGVLRSKSLGERNADEWALLIVIQIERHNEENIVKAEFLDSLKAETIQFECLSDEPIFEIGTFVSKKGDEFSVLHPGKLVPVVFKNGSRILVPEAEAPPPRQTPQPLVAKPAVKASASDSSRGGIRKKAAIQKNERQHFQSKGLSISQFCEPLVPLIRKYAREGTRKPKDVATRLNFEKQKTASGASWTPRLVYILLAQIFEDKAGDRHGLPSAGHSASQSPKAAGQNRPGAKPGALKSADGPRFSVLTDEEIKRRKAALDREALRGISRKSGN